MSMKKPMELLTIEGVHFYRQEKRYGARFTTADIVDSTTAWEALRKRYGDRVAHTDTDLMGYHEFKVTK